MKHLHAKTVPSQRISSALILMGLTLFGGCVSTQSHIRGNNGQAFSECRAEALSMDRAAAEQQSIAQYRLAATQIGQCLSSVDPYDFTISEQEVMQLAAVGILDLVKAGEVGEVKTQIEHFETQFEGRDLYFSDRTSFIDTIRLLVDQDLQVGGRLSLLNARQVTEAEIKRKQYWLNH